MPANNNDLLKPGDLFSRLTIIKFSHKDKHYRRHYQVKCMCGKIKTVQGSLLQSGNTRSCGCLSREVKKSLILPNQQGAVNQIILQYKRHARNRNLEFLLDFEEIDSLLRKPCSYCGATGSNNKKTKDLENSFKYNGIDRVDSSQGYISTNVVPCCKQCNIAKGALSREGFIDWIKRVATHQRAMAEQWGSL